MILISHRGNINGPVPERENKPAQIDMAIDMGYHVEIDIWGQWAVDNNSKHASLHLGHDMPEVEGISFDWLRQRQSKLFVHAKNYLALNFLITDSINRQGKIRFFFHEKERYSLIANTSLVWCHDLTEVNNFSIVPLLSRQDISLWEGKKVFGICSDYVQELKK